MSAETTTIRPTGGQEVKYMRMWLAVTVLAALSIAAGCGGQETAQTHTGHQMATMEEQTERSMQGEHAHMDMPMAAGETTGVREHRMLASDSTEEIVRYRCPMHPQIVRDEPGQCPICGMNLVPFEVAGERTRAMHGQATVTLTEAQRQFIGVRTAAARMMRLTKHIRTVGRVVPDERLVSRVHTKFSGWVEKLHVDYTGREVRRGEPMLEIYSPELVAAQQEYLVAYRARDDRPELLRAARERLRLLDMTDEQIARLEQTGQPQTTVTVYAPHEGTVIEKFVNPGQKVSTAMTLYTIADLSRIWVLADAYEADLPLIRVGQRATVAFPSNTMEHLRGRVTFVSPVVDPVARTAPFRMEFANADGALRPGAFVDVELDVPLGERLAIPRESVLDSGTRQIVFVEVAPGTYEPREVTLGVRTDEWVEVREGVSSGEKVVTSGTFLIDSESQLRAAIAGTGAGHQHQH